MASLAEYVVTIGLVGLGAVAAYQRFGGALTSGIGEEGRKVVALEASSGGDAPACKGGACTDGNTCFTAGTAVATPDGARAIETLRVGEVVCTEGSACTASAR